ncbi:Nucleoside diphosphate kinase 1 [Asimina triloba]
MVEIEAGKSIDRVGRTGSNGRIASTRAESTENGKPMDPSSPADYISTVTKPFYFLPWRRALDCGDRRKNKNKKGIEEEQQEKESINGADLHHDQARWGPTWPGEIISRFEKGFLLKGLKLKRVERAFAEKHYEDLSSKPFFGGLVEYITSGPVVAMVWEGKNVVATGRKIIGATNPSESAPGTIRGDFAIIMGRNVVHGSDSVENGRKEVALWFPDGPVDWQSNLHPWIYE